MFQSKLFFKTEKEVPRDLEAQSHKFLYRGGFINQLTTGSYNFLPLGWRVHRKIENIIREEMEGINAQEVLLPSMIPRKLWEKTNRWNKMDPPLFKLKDRRQNEFGLGSTHEEVITEMAKLYIQSYKNLPISLFQIQNKFRNEMRFTGGLLRTREFIMKDLYSFHQDRKDLDKYFDTVIKSYVRIFKRCGLFAIKSEASGAGFTQKEAKTYEFQVKSDAGEDKVIFCKKCNFAANAEITTLKNGDKCPECAGKLEQINTIEVAHTFTLGAKYSQALNLYFTDKKGVQKLVEMGCYGIGLGRLLSTIVEVCYDERGIIWPTEVAPFDVHLIPINSRKALLDKKIIEVSKMIYAALQEAGIDVLYDDRKDKSPGEKFADSDLIGIPKRVVVSEKTMEENSLEVKERNKTKGKLVKLAGFVKYIIKDKR